MNAVNSATSLPVAWRLMAMNPCIVSDIGPWAGFREPRSALSHLIASVLVYRSANASTAAQDQHALASEIAHSCPLL
jgi:hypothetical protein